jgi:hypothetical protein
MKRFEFSASLDQQRAVIGEMFEGPFVPLALLSRITRIDGIPVKFAEAPRAPNRLFGSYINEDGDAT